MDWGWGYWDKIYANYPRWKLERRPGQPPHGERVPGYVGDTTHRCFRKFDKWYDRPEKAKRLYWRIHEIRRQ